jgi:hypothetical protein
MSNTLLTPTQVTRKALMVLHQKLNFVGTINRGFDYKVPGDLSTYGTSTSDNASATAPAGASYGMHGHIPGSDDGLVDAPNSNGGYGDAQSLSLPVPLPMATIAKTGGDGDGYAVGLHEIVNGRLQFRAPVGSLSPSQRQAIQDNLDTEQEKFYN